MDKTTRELRDSLIAQHGKDVVYADVKRLGLLAVKRPTKTPKSDPFEDYLSSVLSPLESSGVARETLVVESLVYPEAPDDVAKAKRFLKAMPQLVTSLALSIEAMCAGDFTDYVATDEETKKLDAAHEFGWDGIVPSGCAPIILATDETAGTVARATIDASREGNPKLASMIRSATLQFVRSDRSIAEAIIDERPGLLIPLWIRCRDLTGDGVAELGKGSI